IFSAVHPRAPWALPLSDLFWGSRSLNAAPHHFPLRRLRQNFSITPGDDLQTLATPGKLRTMLRCKIENSFQKRLRCPAGAFSNTLQLQL
ncbi:MAG: hypothetical protein AAFR55_00805, partial [Pseudomonadota bacterium]